MVRNVSFVGNWLGRILGLLPLLFLCSGLVLGVELIYAWSYLPGYAVGIGIAIAFISIAFMVVYIFTKIISKFEVLLAASFGNHIPVELIDSSGDRTYTLARRIDDVMVAPVFWHIDVVHVILRSDGTVDPKSKDKFVFFWLPLRRKDRMQHVLSTDLPDFTCLEDLGPVERRKMMVDLARDRKLGVWGR
jgi:hypothetical protein